MPADYMIVPLLAQMASRGKGKCHEPVTFLTNANEIGAVGLISDVLAAQKLVSVAQSKGTLRSEITPEKREAWIDARRGYLALPKDQRRRVA